MTVSVHPPHALSVAGSKSGAVAAGRAATNGGGDHVALNVNVRPNRAISHPSLSGKWRSRRWRISGRMMMFGGVLLITCLVLLQRGAAHWRLHSASLHAWRRALHWYLRRLHVQPLGTRALTAAVIFFFADLAAQRLGGQGICGARLVRYTAYGGAIMGPFLYYWYGLMNAYAPRDDLAAALAKCCFEQLTLEPFCIVLYILYDGAICRRGWREVARRCRTAFFPLWFKNAVFWLPANFCNYYIATPDLRVVFSNLCSLFWNAYFSSKINVPKPQSKHYHVLPTVSEAQV